MTKAEHLANLREDGWSVMEALFSAEEAARLRVAVLGTAEAQREEWQQYRAQQEWAAARPAAGTGRSQGIVEEIPELAARLGDRRLLDVVEGVFGPFVSVSSMGGLVTYEGNTRGHWHSDWPFNQTYPARVPAPYADAVLHLSGIVMLTDFEVENGGTLIVPGSHRQPSNPTAEIGVDRYAPYPGEMNVTGKAGSILLYDSRLWHAVACNRSREPRVGVSVRFAPWWLNLEPRRQGSFAHTRMVVEGRGRDNSVPLISGEAFAAMPEEVRPLFGHWVRSGGAK